MAGKHKALRQKEKEDTEADKKELAKTREEIKEAKGDLADLREQQTSVRLTVDTEIENELHNLAEAKREIAESNMTEDQAVAFLRERLNSRKKA